MDGMTFDMEQEARERLRSVFPDCFSDGALDIDKLLSLCGTYIDNDFEKYKFEWKGKAESLRLAQKRSTGTLRPCPEESVNFNSTDNLFLEGDNLEVLKLLQTAYFRRIKMIYIDPPYNTGRDFVYEDDFRDPMARYKEVTEQTTKSNPETMGRFHTKWLNMMYPRLRLAVNLLRDDGVCFISIDDGEVHNLRKLCDEVFGEENFEGHIHWRRRHNQPNDRTKMIGLVAEHILAYAKNSEKLRAAGVGKIDLTGSFSNPDHDPRGDWASKPWKVGSDQSGSRYAITTPTGTVLEEEWMGDETTYQELLADHRIIFPRGGDGMPRKKYFRYERQEEGQCATNWWDHTQFGHNQGANDCLTELFGVKNVFSNPKPVELLRGLIQISGAKNGDIVLDFFAGSATTAHAVMQVSREMRQQLHFILIQLPENLDKNYAAASGNTKKQLKVPIDFLDSIGRPHFISEIGKERIRRAGAKLLEEQSSQVSFDENPAPPLDVGFKVFKLDTSNLKTWDSTPIREEQLELLFTRMNSMIDRVKEDRTDLDMVYEIMLKLGVPLTAPVAPIEVNGKQAYSIQGDATLLVCLAENISLKDAEKLAALSPAKIILPKSSLADDTAMSNTYYTLRDLGIELKLV